MSLQLPAAPGAYSREDQASLRLLLQNADRETLKREGDIVVSGGLRLLMVDEVTGDVGRLKYASGVLSVEPL